MRRILTLLSVDENLLLRYENLSTDFRDLPLRVGVVPSRLNTCTPFYLRSCGLVYAMRWFGLGWCIFLERYIICIVFIGYFFGSISSASFSFSNLLTVNNINDSTYFNNLSRKIQRTYSISAHFLVCCCEVCSYHLVSSSFHFIRFTSVAINNHRIIYIYIYIVIHRENVSLYHNSSGWLDT